jgi:hypothetical protein
MQCTWCLELKHLRDWKLTQWTLLFPVTEEFDACKICSPTGVRTNTAVVLSTLQRVHSAYNYVAGNCDLRSKLSTLIKT